MTLLDYFGGHPLVYLCFKMLAVIGAITLLIAGTLGVMAVMYQRKFRELN